MNESQVAWLNALPADEAREQLLRVCGSGWWCARVAEGRPYPTPDALLEAGDAAFDSMPRGAWLEAFAHHPRIGDAASLRMKFAGNREWSAGEQAGAAEADDDTLARLAAGNEAYADRFGYTFIICATGRSAAEMLSVLESRLANDPAAELTVAAAEQQKITRLRLAKLRPDGAT